MRWQFCINLYDAWFLEKVNGLPLNLTATGANGCMKMCEWDSTNSYKWSTNLPKSKIVMNCYETMNSKPYDSYQKCVLRTFTNIPIML